jgi:predicted mannosyl-3-phosphoglycerate phosphatase (HAD superfamily)
MRPMTLFPRETLACIDTVFTDVDDTLTVHVRTTSRVFDALERLQSADVRVVPVTSPVYLNVVRPLFT